MECSIVGIYYIGIQNHQYHCTFLCFFCFLSNILQVAFKGFPCITHLTFVFLFNRLPIGLYQTFWARVSRIIAVYLCLFSCSLRSFFLLTTNLSSNSWSHADSLSAPSTSLISEAAQLSDPFSAEPSALIAAPTETPAPSASPAPVSISTGSAEVDLFGG